MALHVRVSRIWLLRWASSSLAASPSSLPLKPPGLFLFPFSTLHRPPQQESACPKTLLLRNEGFSDRHIRLIISQDPRSDKLAWLISLLKDSHVEGPAAGAFLSSHLNLLSADLNNVRLKLALLKDSGLSGSLLRKAVLMKNGVLSLKSSPENLIKHFSFLRDAGLDPFDACLSMSRFPNFAHLGLETNIKPRYEFLLSKGISRSGLCQILRNYPRVFAGSKNPGLLKKLELLQLFGFDLKTRTGVRALGLWSISCADGLLTKFEYMKTIGFSHELAVALVRKQPNLLCLREESMHKKVSYLTQFLRKDLEELLICPNFLTCSLEKRLIPRFTIVEELKERGLISKNIRISSIVTVSDKAFEKRFSGLTTN